jgi:hypothetical protein
MYFSYKAAVGVAIVDRAALYSMFSYTDEQHRRLARSARKRRIIKLPTEASGDEVTIILDGVHSKILPGSYPEGD